MPIWVDEAIPDLPVGRNRGQVGPGGSFALSIMITLVCGPVVLPLMVPNIAIAIGCFDASRCFW
jgi:hypothetical protein